MKTHKHPGASYPYVFLARILLLTFILTGAGFPQLIHAKDPARHLASQILFVANLPLNAGDQLLVDHLQNNLGHQVTAIDDNTVTAQDAIGKDLIYISSTVYEWNIMDEFRTVAVPLITTKHDLYRENWLAMSTSARGNVYSSDDLTILNPSHSLAAGLSGTVEVLDNGSNVYAYGTPSASAIHIGELSTQGQQILFAYESGASMINFTAPARRVGFFLVDNYVDDLTADGWALFDAAVCWALGGCGGSGNAAPAASLVALPISGTAPLAVSFDGTSSSDPDGDPLTYAWDFGDGNSSTASSTTHTYTSAGSYLAKLTVDDGQGNTDEETVTITVSGGTNGAPTASLVALPITGTAPLQVSFDGSSSSDPDGDPLTYAWDFGDGNSSTASSTTHTYTSAGSFVASLTVDDGQGNTDVENVTITVSQPNTGGGSEVLFVAELPLSTGDQLLVDHLQNNLSLSVTTIADDVVTEQDATGKDLIYISSSVYEWNIQAEFRNTAVPLITSKHDMYRDNWLAMSSSTRGNKYSSDDLNILSPSHPIAAGLSGTVEVLDNGSNIYAFGTPSSAATVIGELPTEGQQVLFAYESGATMVGLTAPARRVGFFLLDDYVDDLTTDGWAMVDAAICWAMGGCGSGGGAGSGLPAGFA